MTHTWQSIDDCRKLKWDEFYPFEQKKRRFTSSQNELFENQLPVLSLIRSFMFDFRMQILFNEEF